MFDLPPPPRETSNGQHALAKRHAPILYFDRLEPFLPVAVGYTVFTVEDESSSFKRTVELPEGATTAIEYAVWWDWDIGHLYELEHLWIYLDAAEQLVRGEGSFHGGFRVLKDGQEATPTEQKRLVAYSEPGKHAFAGRVAQVKERGLITRTSCGGLAGHGDVLINHMFRAVLRRLPCSEG